VTVSEGPIVIQSPAHNCRVPRKHDAGVVRPDAEHGNTTTQRHQTSRVWELVVANVVGVAIAEISIRVVSPASNRPVCGQDAVERIASIHLHSRSSECNRGSAVGQSTHCEANVDGVSVTKLTTTSATPAPAISTTNQIN
jgi:hypothetical protein